MRNKKMMNKLAYGGAAAGVGLIFAGLTMRPLSTVERAKRIAKKRNVPDFAKPLVSIAGEETVLMICMDPTWSELCDRASEFYVLGKDEFKELLASVAAVVAFQVALQVNGGIPSLGTPRLFRVKLHAVVEAVRLFRAAVEHKCPSALDDFDEVAADIQRTHDDAAYNMQLDASSAQ
jgi:hypothetical protein